MGNRNGGAGAWLLFSPFGGWLISGAAGVLIALTVIYPSPISIVVGAMGTIGSVGLLVIRVWYQKYPYCGNCGRTLQVCRFECQSRGSRPRDGAGQESNSPGKNDRKSGPGGPGEGEDARRASGQNPGEENPGEENPGEENASGKTERKDD